MVTVLDLRETRGRLCEWCRRRPACQAHHCLLHDTKRFHEELTVAENLMQVCEVCHTGTGIVNSKAVRAWFWAVQVKRYGEAHMLEWLDSLPDKLKWSGRVDFTKSITNNRESEISIGLVAG